MNVIASRRDVLKGGGALVVSFSLAPVGDALAQGKKLHRVQQAFIEEQAAQCGYCINGMIMESAAFLAKTKNPSEADIKKALANNLCRCGTHARIVRAVKRAATMA